MNRILISALSLNGTICGYQRVLKNLISELIDADLDDFIFYIVIQESGLESLDLINKLNKNKNINFIIKKNYSSVKIRVVVEQFLIPYYSLLLNINKILMPCNFGLFLPLKKVTTFIHTNTSFVIDRHLRGRSTFQQFCQNIFSKMTLYTSSKLLFTSSQTYDEYAKFCKKSIPKNILGNGIFKQESFDSVKIFNSYLDNKKYLLSVSQIYRLKNFHVLIEAFIRLKNSNTLGSEIKMVIVGAVMEHDYFHELNILISDRKDIIFLHNISDDYLASLYTNSIGYCLFSLFEGYSLTPGEAILFDLPVAISNINTHTEIYENSCFYANPNNVLSVSDSIISMINFGVTEQQRLSRREIYQKFSTKSFLIRLLDFLKNE